MDVVHLVLDVALLWVLYLASMTLDRVKRLSTQVAVLTLRVADLSETVEALDITVRTKGSRG